MVVPSSSAGPHRPGRVVTTLTVAFAVLIALVGAAGNPATAAGPVSVQPTGLFHITEVSHTGQWLAGNPDALTSWPPVILDRATGATTSLPEGDAHRIVGFVRDNPDLRLEVDSVVTGYVFSALWLHNLASGARVRVDTDSAGNPLFARWMGTGGTYEPTIAVSPKSVSRDGTYVAMCIDDALVGRPWMKVKNLVTGELKPTGVACGVGSSGSVLLPEISHNGRVVHVNGDVDDTADEGDPMGEYYLPDRLVFPLGAVKVRTVKGWGSMTRDGGTLFMLRSTRAPGAKKPSGKVGAYNIKTKKTKALPGRWAIYGSNIFWDFSAFDKASIKGRYVVYGSKVAVIDRKKGRTRNIAPLMRAAGYPPTAYVQSRISGDGKVFFALTPTAVSGNTGRAYVAVTGW
jgi:hypothetical protein